MRAQCFNMEINCFADVCDCLFERFALADTAREARHFSDPQAAVALIHQRLSHLA